MGAPGLLADIVVLTNSDLHRVLHEYFLRLFLNKNLEAELFSISWSLLHAFTPIYRMEFKSDSIGQNKNLNHIISERWM